MLNLLNNWLIFEFDFKMNFLSIASQYFDCHVNVISLVYRNQCQGSCLTELCIQLAIIFVGKQLIQNTLIEIYLPWVLWRPAMMN